MDVHRGSCGHFTTVLSPGSNAFHYNHIHIDLAQHGRSGRSICKPAPQETLPPPDFSPLVAQQAPLAVGDETDNDTSGKPPAAAFDHAASGADALGPLNAPAEPTPMLPPMRPGDIDSSDITSSIRKNRTR